MPHPFSHTLVSIPPTEFVAGASEFTDELMEGVTQFITNSLRHLTRDGAVQHDQWDTYYRLFVDYTGHPLYSSIDRAIGSNLPRLPKRVSAVVYKATGIKLPEKILAKVGEMAAQEDMPVRIADTVHEITWKVGDFGDWNRGDRSNPSCFFGGGYNHSRIKTMPALHAGAIRFYRADKTTGYGRCWYIPLPDDHPSFDPDNPVYAVCNYYGDTPVVFGEVARLILEKQYGRAYTKQLATLVVDEFYVNEPVPYLLTPTGYTPKTNDYFKPRDNWANRPYLAIGQSHFRRGYNFKPKWARHPSPADEAYSEDEEDDPYATCNTCGCNLDEDEVWTNTCGDSYCHGCYHERYNNCAICDNEYLRVDGHRVSGVRICHECYNEHVRDCPSCGNEIFMTVPRYRECYREHTYTDPNTGEVVCHDCGETRQLQDGMVIDTTAPVGHHRLQEAWRHSYLQSLPGHIVVINERGDVKAINEYGIVVIDLTAECFTPILF